MKLESFKFPLSGPERSTFKSYHESTGTYQMTMNPISTAPHILLLKFYLSMLTILLYVYTTELNWCRLIKSEKVLIALV